MWSCTSNIILLCTKTIPVAKHGRLYSNWFNHGFQVPANQKKNGGIGAFFNKTAKPSDEPSKNAPDVKIVETTKSISEVKEIISPKKENKATLNNNKETNNKCSTGSGKESVTSSKKADLKPKVTSKKVSLQCFWLCKFCRLLIIICKYSNLILRLFINFNVHKNLIYYGLADPPSFAKKIKLK